METCDGKGSLNLLPPPVNADASSAGLNFPVRPFTDATALLALLNLDQLSYTDPHVENVPDCARLQNGVQSCKRVLSG